MTPANKRTERRDHPDGALLAHLRGMIAQDGPMTVERYMAEALGNPRFGYYAGISGRGDPLGAEGDFVTAPEISQIFGELIGLWCAVLWRQIGGPKPVQLVELGPGRGTLMADALRASGRTAPDFEAAARVHLVETSPALRAAQRAAIRDPNVEWHDHVDTVPDGPLIVVANEFFDALPIRQYERTPTGWRERLVDMDGEQLCFVQAGAPTGEPLPEARPGTVFESCPTGLGLAGGIAERIAACGGGALIIDYGYAAASFGDTLQAVRGHEPTDVLGRPGTADLTAHVDFAALAGAARAAGAQPWGPITQAAFLTRLGLRERARRLVEDARPDQVDAILSGCQRLIASEEMGTLFKALALTQPGQSAPPAFDPDP